MDLTLLTTAIVFPVDVEVVVHPRGHPSLVVESTTDPPLRLRDELGQLDSRITDVKRKLNDTGHRCEQGQLRHAEHVVQLALCLDGSPAILSRVLPVEEVDDGHGVAARATDPHATDWTLAVRIDVHQPEVVVGKVEELMGRVGVWAVLDRIELEELDPPSLRERQRSIVAIKHGVGQLSDNRRGSTLDRHHA